MRSKLVQNRLASLLGVSCLALALTATSPAWAGEKAEGKSHKTESVKSEAKSESSSKKSKSEAKSDDTDSKSSRSAKSDHKTSKLADSDDDKPAAKSAKSKTKLADADDDSDKQASTSSKGKHTDSDEKVAEKATKAGAKTKPSKLAEDDDAPVKGSKASAEKSKASSEKGKTGKTKLAYADDDTSSKATAHKASADKEAAHKDSRSKLADDDDASSRSSKSKAGTSKAGKKTELADDDDAAPVKGAKGKTSSKTDKTEKSGKTELAAATSRSDKAKTVIADAAPKARTVVAALPAPAKIAIPANPVQSKPVQVATQAAARPGALASLTNALMRLPQSLFAQAAPATPAPVVALNAAPVPYTRIRSQAVNTNGVLTAADAQLYQAAFEQIDGGDYDGAEASLAQVNDKSLVGYAEFHKLFSLNYQATYEELTAWLSQYGDQPTAMRVWALAKRKKPEGAPDPAFPSLMGNAANVAQTLASNGGAAVQLSATTTLAPGPVKADFNPGAPQLDTVDSDLTPKSARSAYNNGQLDQAVNLGRKIGDHWVAGLANWRLKRYDQALNEFKFVSTDPSRNAWSQASGAYWAGRCALRLGDSDSADTYFKIAASFPFTFYGLLAEARLGVTPAVALAKKGLPPTFQNTTRDALTASLTDDFAWTKASPQAHRLSALVQLGRTSDAQGELQTAVQTASDDTARDHWLALATYNHIAVSQLTSSDRLFNASLYPIPEYRLKNDAGVDSALVYAFARKESKFNASAKSYAGAYGLMQLMPGTAALVENDPSFNSKPKQLLKPAVNLRVGQKYIARLRDSQAVGGDLLRTIAAYNAGPGPVKDAVSSLGNDADSLLVMESIPVAQTRQYVEEVAANYWIYRQLMGKDTPSLSQAAADAKVIDPKADAGPGAVAMVDDDDQ